VIFKMRSVFVTGSTGFVGHQIALSFRNAGFRVFGLVRTQEKATILARQEIIPVIGDLTDPKSYESYIEQSSVIIDAAVDYKAGLSVNKVLLETVVKSLEKSSSGSPKTFIYTSGLLVYGDAAGKDEIRDESSVIGKNVPSFFHARIDHEKFVLGQTQLRGVVVRPGFVYGGGVFPGNFLFGIFSNVSKEKFVIRGNKDKRWSWVHKADLADAYVRIATKGDFRGQVFNICGYPHDAPTWEELVLKSANLVGDSKAKIEYGEVDSNDFISSLAERTIVLHPQKAVDLLGWSPRHPGLLAELETYFRAWKAEQ